MRGMLGAPLGHATSRAIPNIVVQNMPGASGRRLMGHMQGIAPKDGTAIAAASARCRSIR